MAIVTGGGGQIGKHDFEFLEDGPYARLGLGAFVDGQQKSGADGAV